MYSPGYSAGMVIGRLTVFVVRRGIEVQQKLAIVGRGRRFGREARSRILVGIHAIVAAPLKNRRRRRLRGIDGLRDDAVLIEGLIEVADVVPNDLGARAFNAPMPLAKSASLLSAV